MGTKYTIIDSEIGKLLLASTDIGIANISFINADPKDKAAFDLEVASDLAQLQRALKSEAFVQDDSAFLEAAKEIREYFAGKRKEFSFKQDKTLSNGFTRKVHDQIAKIPYGQTATYSEIAALIGHPGAARAVGTACGRNTLLFSVPCHRVVATSGLGGYAGRLDIKAHLLQMESVATQ